MISVKLGGIMLIINGDQQELNMAQFANLEELLLKMSENFEDEKQILVDVFVNNQPFSEIYPHQAEDIEINQIEKLELVSISHYKMGALIVEELFIVIEALKQGAELASASLRQGDDLLAINTLKDLIDVNRDFIGMVNSLGESFGIVHDDALKNLLEMLSILVSDINMVIESEDWVVLADLLEFEYYDMCDAWVPQLEELRRAFTSLAE